MILSCVTPRFTPPHSALTISHERTVFVLPVHPVINRCGHNTFSIIHNLLLAQWLYGEGVSLVVPRTLYRGCLVMFSLLNLFFLPSLDFSSTIYYLASSFESLVVVVFPHRVISAIPSDTPSNLSAIRLNERLILKFISPRLVLCSFVLHHLLVIPNSDEATQYQNT